MNKVKSHTKTLLERVKTEELFGTDEGVIRQTIALAEYTRDHRDDIDADELAAAEVVISTFFVVDLDSIEVEDDEFAEMVTTVLSERTDGKGACLRCGRTLSRPQSIDRRMGPTCYAKAAEGNWDFKGEPTTVDTRKDFMRVNDIKPLKDKSRLGLKKMAEHFEVSLSVIRRDRRELKKVIEVEKAVNLLITGEEEAPVLKEDKPEFDPSISCVIYKRKGDGTHCKKQCKNSRK